MEKRILIVGSGGREHAILLALSKNCKKNELYCYSETKNPEIEKLVEQYYIGNVSNIQKIQFYANLINATLVIIGPEKPLLYGVADLLWSQNIPTIGPYKALARIETSKIYAREFLKNHDMDKYNPKFKIIKKPYEDYKFREIFNNLQNSYVIKADGLCGGKGVLVKGDHFTTNEEGIQICNNLIKENKNFLIEEKLIGKEFSYITFSDGKEHYCHTFPIQDYKRAYENDKGPNTGSMGCYVDKNLILNFLTNYDIIECQDINVKVLNLLQKRCNLNYHGFLYGSFIKTETGIKVIEFNARLGDPEGILILDALKNNFYNICVSMIKGTLVNSLTFSNKPRVCAYLVPNGYPKNPVRNHEIYIDNVEYKENLRFSSIASNEYGYMIEKGSRTLAYICSADTLSNANELYISELNKVEGPLFFRKDIGLIKNIQLNYASSGVDIHKADKIVSSIQDLVKKTYNDSVLSNTGSFGGIFQLPLSKEILVSSIDGVGTKTELVRKYYGAKGFEYLGYDMVNHCVNDILVQGAEPLFFMDYIGTNKLNSQEMTYLIQGLSDACIKTGCVLIGGETAEMAGMYKENFTEIVGCITGNVVVDRIIDGNKNIKEGDFIYGLSSSGPHTNGYSLIRKILNQTYFENNEEYHNFYKEVCKPHRCYLEDIRELWKQNINIHGLCHITGGGFYGNIPRILPDYLAVELKTWTLPNLFQKIKNRGNVSLKEMRTVFNCGYGMLCITDNPNLKDWDLLGKVVLKKEESVYFVSQ